MVDRHAILLSVQRALPGEVTPHMRGIALDWDEQIKLAAYFDGDISAEDEEAMAEVDTQVTGDFTNRRLTTDLIRLDCPSPLPIAHTWAFVRNESC